MKKKYFLRKLFIYSVVMLLPVIFLGFSFYIYSNINIKKDINRRSKNTSIMGKEQLELILNISAEQCALFNTNPTIALSMMKILNAKPLSYKDTALQDMITSIISSTANSQNFVDRVYLYIENDLGNFFQSGTSISNVTNSPDSKWLDQYQQMPENVSFSITKRQVKYHTFEAERDTISIFRRLNIAGGVMVLNLSPKMLGEKLSNSQMYHQECIIVTNSDGKILFQNKNADDLHMNYEIEFDDQLDSKNRSELSELFDVTIGKKSYIMTEITSDKYGLRFISLVPQSEIYQLLDSILLFIGLSVIGAFAMSVSLSYKITQKSFRQITNILDTLYKAENGKYVYQCLDSSRDEYDIILDNILKTFIKNNALKLQLNDYMLQQRTAELAALQLQINPHFLFNTLQIIDMEILKSTEINSTASKLVQNLSDILKYALENSTHHVPLKEEIHVCKRYIEIQKFGYEKKFLVMWEYEDDILEVPVIHLLFQPLIENSLHHGIKPSTKDGIVKIKILKRNNGLSVVIIDNGIGISKKELQQLRQNLNVDITPTAHGHIGLRNTNKRLVLTYGSSSSIKIRSKPNVGTAISFFIPIKIS